MRALFIALSLLFFIAVLPGCAGPQKETIIVGSKDFPEQDILGNMLVLLIEAHTDLAAIHIDNMASHVVFSAIGTGAVDVYIEYTGTIYGSFLGLSDTNDATEVYDISAAMLAQRYDLRLLGLLGFNNTFGLAVRQDTAQQFGLQTFSDLARVSSDMTFCGSAELINRRDGLPNLMILYDMSFKESIALHDRQRYEALLNDEAQVAEIFSTDGLLFEYDLVVLEDNKNFFPPYHAVIVARNEILEKHPELIAVLDLLTGKLPDEVMRALNHRVDVGNESPRTVAETFLRAIGLL
jgi:osmoprotectant transport system permease protein